MFDKIGKKNIKTEQAAKSYEWLNKYTVSAKNEKVASIFIDMLGDKNGEVTSNDFKMIETDYRKTKGIVKWILSWKAYFNNKEKGNRVEIYGDHSVETKSSHVYVDNSQKDVIVRKNNKTGEIIATTERKLYENDDGTTSVTMRVEQPINNGKDIKTVEMAFKYSREQIEDYIIEHAFVYGSNNVKIFGDVKSIRQKDPNNVTPKELALLEKFNTLVDTIIETGLDYGVDPNFIVAIMRQEVGFDGTSSKCFGANGKGYMQLTSAPIADFLGCTELPKNGSHGKWGNIKEGNYGPEVKELLLSRGFDPDKDTTPEGKHKLLNDIMTYLKEEPGRSDIEFNIRLGTLVLRYYTNKYDGNVKSAARNYNGSPHKNLYANNVTKYFDTLAGSFTADSVYVKRIISNTRFS